MAAAQDARRMSTLDLPVSTRPICAGPRRSRRADRVRKPAGLATSRLLVQAGCALGKKRLQPRTFLRQDRPSRGSAHIAAYKLDQDVLLAQETGSLPTDYPSRSRWWHAWCTLARRSG